MVLRCLIFPTLKGRAPVLCLYHGRTLTRYVREKAGGKVLAEYSANVQEPPNFRFIYAGDRRIAMYDKTGALHFFLNDHLGSARLVIDSTGVVKDKYKRYFAYGGGASQTVSTGQKYQYTGQPYDDDGAFDLYYYGARYYDPVLGRFTSRDPKAQRYPSWSPYAYAAGNPLEFIDQFGDSLTTFKAMGFESGQTRKERTYYVDTKIAEKMKGFVGEATTEFKDLSINMVYRDDPSTQLVTTNTIAKGLSRHQAGFALDLNKVGSLSGKQLKQLNAIAQKYGFFPLKKQSSDLPHFSADPKKFGYKSLADAVKEDLLHYQHLTKEKKEDDKKKETDKW